MPKFKQSQKQAKMVKGFINNLKKYPAKKENETLNNFFDGIRYAF